MAKYEALSRTNLGCSGCSPGKSPFGALTRFPLQSGQGVEAAGPQYLLGHVPIMMVTRLPSFNPIGPMPTAADPPLALGPAARPLGEVLDLD